MRISYLLESVGVRLIFLILIDALVVLLGILLFNLEHQYIVLKIGIFIILGALAFGTFKSSQRFVKGMDGESDVWKELKNLPSEYYILHDFVGGKRGNIDYIVVGPTGLWTIEVKSQRETNIDNKYLEHHIYQAYAESKALSDLLLLPVVPILVFTNPKAVIHFGLKKQKGVFVIGKKWLVDLIQKKEYGSYISPAECERIYNQLKKNVSAA